MSTSSAGDTPANPSPTSVGALVPMTTGISGPICETPLLFYDHDSHCWRTSQGTFPWASDEFSGIWPSSGMTRNGQCFPLPRSVPRTSETDSFVWPTPVANDDNKSVDAHLAMKERMPGGPRKKITSLNVMVKRWPTPTARDYKDVGDLSQMPERGILPRAVQNREKWPTPTARLGDNRGPVAKRFLDPAYTNELDNCMAAIEGNGNLNPTWVEWLMGFPLGFTDLGDWGTRSSRKSPK